jgi:hypothetical protein
MLRLKLPVAGVKASFVRRPVSAENVLRGFGRIHRLRLQPKLFIWSEPISPNQQAEPLARIVPLPGVTKWASITGCIITPWNWWGEGSLNDQVSAGNGKPSDANGRELKERQKAIARLDEQVARGNSSRT